MEFAIEQKQDKDNKKGLFYLERAQERIGQIDYRLEGKNTLVIERTEVIPSFRGTGAAKQLVDKVLRLAESEELELKSECDYFSKQWEKMR